MRSTAHFSKPALAQELAEASWDYHATGRRFTDFWRNWSASLPAAEKRTVRPTAKAVWQAMKKQPALAQCRRRAVAAAQAAAW